MRHDAALNGSADTEIFAQYDHLRYSTFEYDTFTPAGDRIENVRDTPRAHSISFVGETMRVWKASDGFRFYYRRGRDPA